MDVVSAAPLAHRSAFFIVTPWEIGVILTANYTFLNYLVLVLGFLLLDDRFLRRFLPVSWKILARLRRASPRAETGKASRHVTHDASFSEAVRSTLMLSWIFYVDDRSTARDVLDHSFSHALPSWRSIHSASRIDMACLGS